MRRREFITILGGATAWPLTARAQQSTKLPIVGFLGAGTLSAWSPWVAAFVQRLRELGWTEGRTIRLRAGGLVISGGQFFNSRSKQLAALALHHGVPTAFPYREFAAAGGLVSYGTSIVDAYRLAGVYSGRVLKGEKPADLPVQQATKVELVINLKTARTLGITIPLPLIGRADEVIE
jgi:hypothetical protein